MCRDLQVVLIELIRPYVDTTIDCNYALKQLLAKRYLVGIVEDSWSFTT